MGFTITGKALLRPLFVGLEGGLNTCSNKDYCTTTLHCLTISGGLVKSLQRTLQRRLKNGWRMELHGSEGAVEFTQQTSAK